MKNLLILLSFTLLLCAGTNYEVMSDPIENMEQVSENSYAGKVIVIVGENATGKIAHLVAEHAGLELAKFVSFKTIDDCREHYSKNDFEPDLILVDNDFNNQITRSTLVKEMQISMHYEQFKERPILEDRTSKFDKQQAKLRYKHAAKSRWV